MKVSLLLKELILYLCYKSTRIALLEDGFGPVKTLLLIEYSFFMQ